MNYPMMRLIRFEKPTGTFLLMWPTLWALVLSKTSHYKIWILFLLGVFITRSLGCILNDVWDSKIDTFVKRTKERPLASGVIGKKEALTGAAVFSIIAFYIAWELHVIPLSIGALLIMIVYPLMKRFFPCPQLVLGLAFSQSIPMVYAASNLAFNWDAGVLMLATICWVIIYDTEYALSDREDDRALKLSSFALTIEGQEFQVLIMLSGLFLVLLNMTCGLTGGFSPFSVILLCVGSILFAQLKFLKGFDPKVCQKIFHSHHIIGILITLGFILETYA